MLDTQPVDLKTVLRGRLRLCSRFSGCSGPRYFSLRQVYQKGPNSIRSKDRAEKILGILFKHGLARPAASAVEIDGSLCRTAWEARP